MKYDEAKYERELKIEKDKYSLMAKSQIAMVTHRVLLSFRKLTNDLSKEFNLEHENLMENNLKL